MKRTIWGVCLFLLALPLAALAVLPAPDYDTGWLVSSGEPQKIFHHLETSGEHLLVNVILKDKDGKISTEGCSWILENKNVLTVTGPKPAPDLPASEQPEFRVQIWITEPAVISTAPTRSDFYVGYGAHSSTIHYELVEDGIVSLFVTYGGKEKCLVDRKKQKAGAYVFECPDVGMGSSSGFRLVLENKAGVITTKAQCMYVCE